MDIDTFIHSLIYIVFGLVTLFFLYIAIESIRILKNYPHVRENFVLMILYISINSELISWICGMSLKFSGKKNIYQITTVIEDGCNNIAIFALSLRIIETLSALEFNASYVSFLKSCCWVFFSLLVCGDILLLIFSNATLFIYYHLISNAATLPFLSILFLTLVFWFRKKFNKWLFFEDKTLSSIFIILLFGLLIATIYSIMQMRKMSALIKGALNEIILLMIILLMELIPSFIIILYVTSRVKSMNEDASHNDSYSSMDSETINKA